MFHSFIASLLFLLNLPVSFINRAKERERENLRLLDVKNVSTCWLGISLGSMLAARPQVTSGNFICKPHVVIAADGHTKKYEYTYVIKNYIRHFFFRRGWLGSPDASFYCSSPSSTMINCFFVFGAKSFEIACSINMCKSIRFLKNQNFAKGWLVFVLIRC